MRKINKKCQYLKIAHNWTGSHSHNTTNTDTFHCIRILRPITINRNNVVLRLCSVARGCLPTCVYELDQNVIYSAENCKTPDLIRCS